MTVDPLASIAAEPAEHFPALREVCEQTKSIRRDTLVKDVADDFFRNASLDAIAVVEEGKPVGLVTRAKFLFTVFRQYGWEIFARKPIDAVAISEPLVLADSARLDSALASALERPQQDVYDEIVVVDESGNYVGLLSVRQMVLQQSHSLGNILVQKELAHSRARELEEIDRIKSQFLATVTHELRSPVNAIIELAELLRMSAEKGYAGQVRDRLTLLMQCATNLRSVITNILDLSKIESGRMTVIIEPFDLVPILQEIAETTRVLLGGKPVEVVVATGSSSVVVHSDPVKLRQILLNFASNAAKFTESGRIAIALTTSPEMMAISVSDTGPGIRKEDLDKLFVAFSQLEDAHTTRHRGTGLGLAITRELARMLEGHVEVTSEFGSGSTFTAVIPTSQSGERNHEQDSDRR